MVVSEAVTRVTANEPLAGAQALGLIGGRLELGETYKITSQIRNVTEGTDLAFES
jgi:hypothetical protein